MKITWSRRKTSCTLCEESIPAKEQRLDDTVRIGKNGLRIIRLHYHPECYISRIRGWIEDHPYKPLDPKGGHPELDLSPEKAKTRRLLLSNLSSLKQYYFPKGREHRINLQGDIETLTEKDLRRFKRYVERYKKITKALEEVGGLPESRGGPHAIYKQEAQMT